jgi:hypothetical protein
MEHVYRVLLCSALLALTACAGGSPPPAADSSQPPPTPSLARQFPTPQPGVQLPAADPVEIDFDSADDKATSAVYRIFFRDAVNEHSYGRWATNNVTGKKQWELSNTYYSAPKAWVIGQNYWNDENDWLNSRQWSFPEGSAGMALTFQARWNIAAGDQLTIWYSDPAPGDWQVVNFTGGSNPNYPGWDRYYFRLPDDGPAPGNTGSLHLNFQSNHSGTGWGFGIDNIAVYQTQLAAPRNVQASDGSVADQVDVTWEHNNAGTLVPDGYAIYRAPYVNGEMGPFAYLDQIAYPGQLFSDGRDDASMFYYKVVAVKAGWPDSPDSSTDGGFAGGQWHTATVTNSGTYGEFSSLQMIEGRPAICHYDPFNGNLLFSIAAPGDFSTWNTYTVDGLTEDVGDDYPSLAEINGVPAIAYYDVTNSRLKYALSASSDGSGSWTSLVVDATPNTGQSPSLALVNGRPAISYGEQDGTGGGLHYAYSSTPDGSSGWNALVVDASPEAGIANSLAEVNGAPAIAYYNGTSLDLRFAYSATPDGSSGWAALDVETAGFTGLDPSLAVIDGRPAIAFIDVGNSDLRYAFSSEADGSSGWSSVLADDTGGYFASLALVYGRPGIASYGHLNHDLRYAVSLEENGSGSWNGIWLENAGDVGYYPSLTALPGGQPVISYWDYTDNALRLKWFD